MKYLDVNCLIGHYPFRKIRKNTFDDLRSLHASHEIDGGFVASLESVFYNDPLEGDKDLYRVLKGSAYQLVGTINPMLPAFLEDLDVCVNELGAKAIRIYPTYHGYGLDHADCLRLCAALQARNIPLFICGRLEDERLEYIIMPKTMEIAKIAAITAAYPALKIVLLSFRREELCDILPTIAADGNLYFDASGLKNNLFAIDRTLEGFGGKKLLFGSQWPLYCFTSTWLKVIKAECSQQAKEEVFTLAQTLL